MQKTIDVVMDRQGNSISLNKYLITPYPHNNRLKGKLEI
ncbi:hypothetical protein HMPREF1505_1795 [Prevotella sp. ICM33]|nr:hypothetical protein HMPREF1505_1795 [Prevotella sp. ICM33]